MATSTNQIDFTLNADTSSFETNINNSSKAVEKLSKNNDDLSAGLEDVSKFMKEAAKVNTDLTKAIKDLAKAFDSSIDSTNKEADALDDVSKEAKDAAKEIKKVSDAAKDIEKNSKAGNIALEAIKDNLGSIPVAGNSLTRMLDGLEGSFTKLAVAGLGVGAIGGGFLALGGTIYGAYTQSEKFRDSIEDFKANAAVAFTPMLNTLGNIGDAIGSVIDGLNKWRKTANNISGATTDAVKKLSEETLKNLENISVSAEEQIKQLKDLGYTEKEIAEESAKIWADAYAQIEEDSIPAMKTLKDGFSDLVIAQSDILQRITQVKEEQKQFGGVDIYYDSTGYVRNFKEELEKLDEELKQNQAEQKNNMLQREQLKLMSKNAREEQDKLNDSTQSNTKVTQNQISAYEKLTQSLAAVIEGRNAEARIIEDNYTGKAKELEAIKANINALEQQKQLITSYYIEAKKQGKDYYDESLNGIIAQINGNEEVTGSVEDLGKALQKINQLLAEQKKQYEELNKPLLDLNSIASQIMSSIQSAYNSISSAVMSIKSMDLIDTSKFDEQIEHIQNKLDEFDEAQRKKEEEKQELDDEAYQNYLARLDEEYQKAVEANDLMSQEAIRIKKEEVEKKREQEKKELEEEKKINKQREELEQQLAIAQYNKDYAEWQNQVKLAELQKNKALADAIVSTAQSIANAAMMPLQPGWASMGPFGIAAAAAAGASALGVALGGIAGVQSAASALDNVKGNPPEMPQFEFGTTGYTLGYGETALVGERGAELVKNMGGILQVQSAAQTEAMGFRGGERIGMYIENLVFNVAQRLTAEELYEVMTTFKARDIRFRR
ncbi:hypothetical protein R4J09_00530 [Brachyspira intermedia]|uniref:hypothetical protein n=1 Tax=Brachyspira intermedia TaxID=84377 RepID=UPI0030067DBB